MAEKKWTYPLVGVPQQSVAIHVPKESDYMTKIDGHVFAGKAIPEHWKHGRIADRIKTKIGTKVVIVNQNFYGITETDLGTTITATVQFKKKVSADGGEEEYLLMDITKTSGQRTSDIKFSSDGDGPIVPRTNIRVNIVPRKQYKPMQMAS